MKAVKAVKAVNKMNGLVQSGVRRALPVGCVICVLSVVASLSGMAGASPSPVVHVWEKQELTFTASRSWSNPYTEVTVWVDLAGPGFRKRIYGFWDGDRTFRVRLLAPAPGDW